MKLQIEQLLPKRKSLLKRMASGKAVAFYVWLQILLGTAIAVETQMESQFEHCCGLGTSWASEGLTCESFTGPVSGVANVEQGLCLSAVDICCVKLYHEKQCEIGKNDARSGLACAGNSAPGGEYHRDCCEGCKLGILTGSMGQGCAFKRFAFGKPWDPAFLECCHESLPSTIEPLTEPESSSTSLQPTSPSMASTSSAPPTSTDKWPTPELDDFCSLMQGQLCTDICIPSPGSYKCACRDGFTLLEDGKTCIQDSPADRCNKNNPCEHRCTDSGEAIVCSCNPGYVLASDKHSCRPKQTETTPEGEDNDLPAFRCPDGYRYKAANQVCDDIDECEQNVCPGRCENTIGSYTCLSGPTKPVQYNNACPPGYAWEEEESLCVDIDECLEQPNTCDKETHVCVNTQGSFTCHQLTGTGPRSCPAGFKYDKQNSLCKDVDECAEGIHGCSEENEECRNTDGAYECDVKCQPGFTFSINLGICTDIDECVKDGSKLCPNPGSKCINTRGGYECVNQRVTDSINRPVKGCPAGLKPIGDGTEGCRDVDECREGLHSCNAKFQICVNMVGSYRCDSISEISGDFDGSEEAFDNWTDGYGDEEETSQSTIEDQNTYTTVPPEPTCLPGYEYNAKTDQCNDINECLTNRHNCTGPLLECVNLPATYRCDCKDGFELNITTLQCQDVDECKRGLTKCSTGERCVNSIGGHQCTPACPMGLQPHPTIENLCQDIDECELGLHSCPANSHVCVNTNGSYVCDVAAPCPRSGYARDQVSGQCLDIDECIKGPGCREHERCINSPGTYNCVPLCNTGWLFNPQMKICQDVDECLLGRHNCPQNTHSCRNTNGSFLCDPIPPCRNGYRRSPDGICLDVDECTENVHNCLISRFQYCTNREGSFECITRFPACDRGYEFSLNARACQDIDECASNQNTCDVTRYQRCVNLPGTYRCEGPPHQRPQQQPACPAGYSYHHQRRRCVDIDECAEGTHKCGKQQCFNQPGSYTCARSPPPISTLTKCGTGSRYTRLGCEDIDECKEIEDACSSNEQCANTLGSFTCTCNVGFMRDNITQACVDINECQIQSHGCLPTQRCDNTPGSYTCVRFLNCGTGYTLNAASEICEDDDECALGTHDCSSGYHCRNTPGSYRCEKNSRYSVTTSRTVRFYNTVPSITTRQTVNSNGYGISCPQGYVVIGNQCVDQNECEGPQSPCSPTQNCINTRGSYSCISRIRCGPGYKLDESEQRCVDVDECAERIDDCGRGQNCVNRPGGYICSCPPGHAVGPNKDCVDIDECSIYPGKACSSNSRCENTVGSYRCICQSGFKNVGDISCVDVDECKESPGICQHKCMNVWGSYKCVCNAGFRLNLDGRSCTDVDECMEFKENNLCVGICQNTPGSYLCQCPKGYRLGSDQRTCQDIDECEDGRPCKDQNEVCQNTRGSYRCNRIDCPSGYHRDTERKNRCLRTSRYCQSGDYECFRSPAHFSYNFITFVSMLPIPPTGQLELFTMRGSGQFGSTIEFRMELVNVRAPPGIQRATEGSFRLRKPAQSQAVIALVQSLQGPQEIELRLSMEIYNGVSFAGSAVVKLFLFVSEYEF